MENLIISDLRTKEELSKARLVSDIYLAGFHGYLTVVRPVDGRFDSVDIDLFLDYDADGRLRSTISIYESDEIYFLDVFQGETVTQWLARVRNKVLSEMEKMPNTEELCEAFLQAVNILP